MRYDILRFTDNEELAGPGVYLLSDQVLLDLENRTFRCEDASRVMSYDPNVCFSLRRELISCIDESNVVGYLNRFEMRRYVNDIYTFSAEYWPINLIDPIEPTFIPRAIGERYSEHVKLLTELYAIDILFNKPS